jgi:hypothetical protein
VFPTADKIIAAMEAEDAGEEVKFDDLGFRLGYVEAAGVDVDALDMRVVLDRMRLDLTDYVGPVPGTVSLDVAGLDLPTELLEEADVKEPLLDLGYDRLLADYGVKLAWHEADETITVDELRASVAEAFSFSASAVLGGVKREDLLNAEALNEALAKVTLLEANATVSDPELFNRWIAQQAWMEKVDQKDYRAALADGIPDMLSDIGDEGFRTMLATALNTFIMTPGSLTVTAEPPDKTAVSGLVAFGGLFPSALPDVLGLKVTAIAGPEPVPYDYVPRQTDRTTPDVIIDPSDRHVPFKK